MQMLTLGASYNFIHSLHVVQPVGLEVPTRWARSTFRRWPGGDLSLSMNPIWVRNALLSRHRRLSSRQRL